MLISVKPVSADATVAYPHSQWYAAAFSEDVTRTPLARTLLNQRVVLYRTEAGDPVALADRCAHRSAPLSKGALVGDLIECPFHGMQYGPDGNCSLIPCQDKIPSNARVRSYPAVDQHGHIWLWFGEASKADATLIPDLHWMTDPHLVPVKGTILIKTNYLAVLDNLLDDTHLPFVHRNSIGTAKMVAAPIDVRSGDDWVGFSRWTLDTPPSAVHAKAGGFTTNVDRWFDVRFVKPTTVTIAVGSAPVGTGAPEGDCSKGISLFSNGTLTPGAGNTTWYFWHNARSFALKDEQLSKTLHADMVRTFVEDSEILEAVEEVIDSGTPAPPPLVIAGDAVPLRARRIINRLIAGEGSSG